MGRIFGIVASIFVVVLLLCCGGFLVVTQGAGIVATTPSSPSPTPTASSGLPPAPSIDPTDGTFCPADKEPWCYDAYAELRVSDDGAIATRALHYETVVFPRRSAGDLLQATPLYRVDGTVTLRVEPKITVHWYAAYVVSSLHQRVKPAKILLGAEGQFLIQDDGKWEAVGDDERGNDKKVVEITFNPSLIKGVAVYGSFEPPHQSEAPPINQEDPMLS